MGNVNRNQQLRIDNKTIENKIKTYKNIQKTEN